MYSNGFWTLYPRERSIKDFKVQKRGTRSPELAVFDNKADVKLSPRSHFECKYIAQLCNEFGSVS